MDEAELRASFTDLFAPVRWGGVAAAFVPGAELPPADLIASVNVVPFCGERAVVPRLADGHPEVPGGRWSRAKGTWTRCGGSFERRRGRDC